MSHRKRLLCKLTSGAWTFAGGRGLCKRITMACDRGTPRSGAHTHMNDVGTAMHREAPTVRALVRGQRRGIDPDGPSVAVVIPAMNEAKNLPSLAGRMPRGISEIVLVDGHSQDETVVVARELWPHVRVISQNRRGKGNALACGFADVGSDITVMIDADGSMNPAEIPYFVDALTAGADYAKGSRFMEGGGSGDITRVRALGNRLLNAATRLAHGTSYTDLCYGYNAFWTRIRPVLDLDPGTPADDHTEKRWGDGFEVETLINIRVHTAGLRIAEVPSYESPRVFGESNLNAVSDGLRVLRTIAAERRRTPTPRRSRQQAANVRQDELGVVLDFNSEQRAHTGSKRRAETLREQLAEPG